jgi:Tfp pilus assembly protein PilF
MREPDSVIGSRLNWMATRPWYLVIGLCVLTLAVYANSFRGQFVYDDIRCIVEHGSIGKIWPDDASFTTGRRRPIGHITLALNYACGGLNVTGYHAVNIAIHLLAGLTLFDLLRRTLQRTRTDRDQHLAASWLAFVVAALWLLHPMQTEAVTYIVQRLESLMALFFLLCIYCLLRGSDSPYGRWWYLGSIVACWLGMGSKETMAVAPLVALLYDRTFLSDSWKTVLRHRGWVYGGYLLPFVWLLNRVRFFFDANADRAMGFRLEGISPWDYLLSQPGVILHYLRLSIWPDRLCLDWMWPVAQTSWTTIASLIVIGAMLSFSLWAMWYRPRIGFLSVFFFLVLAPTSSIVPIRDLAVERRMYLPLAALITLIVLAVCQMLAKTSLSNQAKRRVALLLSVSVVLALSLRTVARNCDYSSPVAMWSNVLRSAPHNYRAHYNLAKCLADEGSVDRAEHHFRRAIALAPGEEQLYRGFGEFQLRSDRTDDAVATFAEGLESCPDSVNLRYNLAAGLAASDRFGEARQQCLEVLDASPKHALARNQLGLLMLGAGETDVAIDHFERAVAEARENADFNFNLASAYEACGRDTLACEYYERALECDPAHVQTLNNLAALLARTGRPHAAQSYYERILALDSQHEIAGYNLALMLIQQGKANQAERHLRRVVKAAPQWSDPWLELGRLLSRNGQIEQAVACLTTGINLEPTNAAALNQLGLLLARLNEFEEAERRFREALIIVPDAAGTYSNLGAVMFEQGRSEEAAEAFSQALKLDPTLPQAQRGLATATGRAGDDRASQARPSRPRVHR